MPFSKFKPDVVKAMLFVQILCLAVLILQFLVSADINKKLKVEPADVLERVNQIQEDLETK